MLSKYLLIVLSILSISVLGFGYYKYNEQVQQIEELRDALYGENMRNLELMDRVREDSLTISVLGNNVREIVLKNDSLYQSLKDITSKYGTKVYEYLTLKASYDSIVTNNVYYEANDSLLRFTKTFYDIFDVWGTVTKDPFKVQYLGFKQIKDYYLSIIVHGDNKHKISSIKTNIPIGDNEVNYTFIEQQGSFKEDISVQAYLGFSTYPILGASVFYKNYGLGYIAYSGGGSVTLNYIWRPFK